MKSIREMIGVTTRPDERFTQEVPDTSIEEVEPAPPASPVPITMPSLRQTPPVASERFFFITTTTSAGTGVVDKQFQFGVNSVKVSNLSTQWVYLPDIDEFVPPQNWMAVLRGNGSMRFRAIFETPPGITAAGITSSNERVMFMVTQEMLPLSAGIGGKTS